MQQYLHSLGILFYVYIKKGHQVFLRSDKLHHDQNRDILLCLKLMRQLILEEHLQVMKSTIHPGSLGKYGGSQKFEMSVTG